MAALRIFARSKLSAIFRASQQLESLNNISPAVIQVHKRWSTYRSSPIYKDPSKYTDYEILKNPPEWEYVQRLLKPKVIPVPSLENTDLPSGWKPPTSKPGTYPYFVQRTKNYMIPVYLLRKFRGMQRITQIRKIQGDIWALESELMKYIEDNVGKKVGIRVNELAGTIKLRGDYVSLLKKWFEMKGF